ncbi:hypothetical protein Tco_0087928 [Tanacetum coccineum]
MPRVRHWQSFGLGGILTPSKRVGKVGFTFGNNPKAKLSQARFLTTGILTNKAVCSGTLAKAGEKRKERDDSYSIQEEKHGHFQKCARCKGFMLKKTKAYVATIAKARVANGKKEEVDRIFRGCRLELGDSIFPIDLIPLGQGSFDVIVGNGMLSNEKYFVFKYISLVTSPSSESSSESRKGDTSVVSTNLTSDTMSSIPRKSGGFKKILSSCSGNAGGDDGYTFSIMNGIVK